jgi:twinkle protein
MSQIQTYADYGITGINLYGTGEQRTTCPKCSSQRKPEHQHVQCLAVNVEKKTWLCHHCGWQGGLKQVQEKREWKPVETENQKSPSEALRAWFHNERGITPAVLDKNRVEAKGDAYIEGKKQPAIAFNYFIGEMLVNVKYRTKDKKFSQVKDGAQVLYGLNDIENEAECIICEGEMDKLSFNVADLWNAVSVPNGAPPETAKNTEKKMEFLSLCAAWLDNKNKIYLATDADAPGLRLREELARRLGKNRCWIVRYPEGCKDANDVLKKHGVERLRQCIEKAEMYPVEGVFSVNDFADDFADLYENGYPDGAKSGYPDFDRLISFHKGQLTAITGVPRSGKSNFLDQILIRLADRHQWKTALFTPENYPIKVHLQRLAEILVGKPFLPNLNGRMSKAESNIARLWLNESFFYVLPPDENFKLDAILERIAHLVMREGIQAAVIDPWNTIEHQRPRDMTETEYVGKVLNKLKYFARNHDIHLFVVAHPTKMSKQADGVNYEVPTLYSIMGSSNWFNVVDNGFVVHRQFDKTGVNSTTTVYVQKIKHRYIGVLGYARFEFEESCQRYTEISAPKQTGEAVYMPEEVEEEEYQQPF